MSSNCEIEEMETEVRVQEEEIQERPSLPNTSTAVERSSSANGLIGRRVVDMMTSFHAGYFRISLSLCSQALLWKTLRSPSTDPLALRFLVHSLPSFALVFLWSLALLSLLLLSLLFLSRCLLRLPSVRAELSHHVGMNYLFAPFASSLLLLQSTPFLTPHSTPYLVLCCLISVPIIALDLLIYGAWLTHGRRFLSLAANPTSHLSVIGNLVGARAVAQMGWLEVATCMFSLGMMHYVVLFVTLYQRVIGGSSLPVMLRPAFFLFFAAPSMASLAWRSIAEDFDTACKMLFFLSLFLFASLDMLLIFFPQLGSKAQVSRPTLFKRSMKRFNVAWWAYSFPLTVLALAATEYAQKVKALVPNALMLVLSVLSVAVTLLLLVFTAVRTNDLLPRDDPFQPLNSTSTPLPSTLALSPGQC